MATQVSGSGASMQAGSVVRVRPVRTRARILGMVRILLIVFSVAARRIGVCLYYGDDKEIIEGWGPVLSWTHTVA
jgi:hypothetical protein